MPTLLQNSSQVVLPEPWQSAGFGLYVHWPYCQAKCPYCDFNSHVTALIDQGVWRQSYLSEIARVGAETPGRVLRSIYFGGGTPSLMDVDVVEGIIAAAANTWTLANDCEITLEANPTSVEASRFNGYRAAGVNRVSLGVQALRDADLKRLGRLHSAAEARAALDIARDTFDRVSFDLIYARQEQTLDGWQVELEEALALEPDHLSLYQLTVEEGTAFGDRFEKGLLRGLPDDDVSADMFLLTQQICEGAGLPAYEVSNHARAGQESRHNLIYWQSGDWAAIGPGGHGRLTLDDGRWATSTVLEPIKWLHHVKNARTPELERTNLSDDDQEIERILMGLRVVDGISESYVKNPVYLNNINTLVKDGLLHRHQDQLSVAKEHRPVLNAVLREILRD